MQPGLPSAGEHRGVQRRAGAHRGGQGHTEEGRGAQRRAGEHRGGQGCTEEVTGAQRGVGVHREEQGCTEEGRGAQRRAGCTEKSQGAQRYSVVPRERAKMHREKVPGDLLMGRQFTGQERKMSVQPPKLC